MILAFFSFAGFGHVSPNDIMAHIHLYFDPWEPAIRQNTV